MNDNTSTSSMNDITGEILSLQESGMFDKWAKDRLELIGYQALLAHLPKSTLMMLVSALMGRDRIAEIYAHAINARYRFFSYGDSSLLLPKGV